MANVNKLIMVGRLCRDPETRAFQGGGKVVQFGFVVNGRKKDQATGNWIDEPMFIDGKIFGRSDNSKQADLFAESCKKGHQVYLEGRLALEQWDDKNSGQKRSKHVIVVDNFQFLEKREGGQGQESQPQRSTWGGQRPEQEQRPQYSPQDDSQGDIPF